MPIAASYNPTMPKDMAEQLRTAIRKRKETGLEIAIATGVPQASISDFLRGKDIRLATATKLANYLGLELRPKKKR